ncbi:hypothetical protein [Methylobacterium sp. NFXW15]|uniref:hypothetical protein n=1 Tax=Methylobacterium sp. NFXW15 TaxID=2819512 RepID=UPI003CEBC47D
MNGLLRLLAELDLAALTVSLFAVAVMALAATLVVRRAARLPSAERVRLRALERRLNAVEARLNRTERDLDP